MEETNNNFDIDCEGHISYHTGEPASFMPNLVEETYEKETFVNNYIREGTVFTISFPGTVLRVWKDREGVVHFSTRKQIDAINSFWGNKNKKFVDLFLQNGGQNFLDNITLEEGTTYCFTIIDLELITRTRLDLRDNETVIGYIGCFDNEGNFIERSDFFKDNVFFNYKPSNMNNIIPTREELSSRVLLPISLDPETCIYILENGYSNEPVSHIQDVKNNYHSFSGECVIARNQNTVIKICPQQEYEMRDLIDGNKHNRLNILFLSMDHANTPEKYSKYLELGIFNPEEFKNISACDISKSLYNLFMEKRANNIEDYDSQNVEHRRINILANFLIFCPLPQVHNFIDYWGIYQQTRGVVFNFLMKHNGKVRNNKYDEQLKERHERALTRMKDLAGRSHDYASDKVNKNNYHVKLRFKLENLLIKEYGSSLYRIRNAILFLRD